LKRRNGAELTKQTPVNKGASVFLHPNFAKTIYSARRFYVNAKFNAWNEEGHETGMERTKDEKTAMRLQLRNEWNDAKAKDPNFGTTFEKQARDHAAKQKGMKTELVDVLNRQNQRSFQSLKLVTSEPA
jgi:hypothetical protein